MNYAETILPEFDREMANTRKVLERVPEDKLDWQAHPKSHTIGWNANHLAEIPGWVEGALTAPSWDIAPTGGEPYQSPKLTRRQEILDLFDRNVAAARKAIAAVQEDQLTQPWSLLKAGAPLFTMPRAAMIRGFVLNHLIHHRAILCVYLRLNDIPVPGMYGPSGDEFAGWVQVSEPNPALHRTGHAIGASSDFNACSRVSRLVSVAFGLWVSGMDYDTDKVDEAVLALLYLTLCGDRYGARAWKSHDWGALDRLHEKGYIDDPKSKAKSVALTEEGRAKAEELFRKLFGKPSQELPPGA